MNKNSFESVTFLNFNSCEIDSSVTFGKNVTIYGGNIIKGNCHIGDNVVLKNNNYILNSNIGENSEIEFSHIVESTVYNDCKIGPYSRIRPNCNIGNNCKVGNFVEIKNSCLGDGTKASHLAYIGDAIIGKNCNVGCGVIFANYNGKSKNKILVGNNCFIGSNVNLIAPLEIADSTYICAGTTLTKNTNKYDFIIGREKETIKPEKAKKYLKEE